MQRASVLLYIVIALPVLSVSAREDHPRPFAGEERNIVPSTLRSATVYRIGADLVHTATATLRQGNNDLIIDDISNDVDEGSIRVSCKGNVTIMSVAFSTEYLKPGSPGPFVRKLQDSIDAAKDRQAGLDVLVKSDNELLELLSANRSIGGANNGLTVAELSKMVDYYKQKIVALRTELNDYHAKAVKLSQLIDKLQNQVREEEKKNSRTGGRILLQLLSPLAGTFDFTISYLTRAAHWDPFYDLQVDRVDDPLKIRYKAKLVQTSGIDWKKVKLSLSTSLPSQGGNAPVVKTWFLRFTDPVALMEDALKANSMLMGSAAGLSVKKRSISLQDVVATGYGGSFGKTDAPAAPAAATVATLKDELGDYISVNDNQLDVVFDIDIPYDVPANGKEQGVVLKEYKVNCTYRDYAAPGLEKEAYLLGAVPGWEKLNLLPGEANIIVEGTYIGKSYIDPSTIQDTLNLTLGRDKRIVVKKEKVIDYSSVKFLGASKKQRFTYEITVRNNKKEKASLLLKDQYPVSSNKDIETELTEAGGATVDKDTGILTWALTLEPGESRKYRISYSVKFPKDKTINIKSFN